MIGEHQPEECATTQKGYIFAEFDIVDADKFYNEYMPRVKPVLEQFGARFLVATNSPEMKEGERVYGRVILLEFDSPELAKIFYQSQSYQDVIDLRRDSAKGGLYILDGLANHVASLGLSVRGAGVESR